MMIIPNHKDVLGVWVGQNWVPLNFMVQRSSISRPLEIRQNAHLVSGGPKGWQSHCGESGSQGEEEVRSFSSFLILYFKCFTSIFLEDFYLKVILGSTFV